MGKLLTELALESQIRSELAFLNTQGIKSLVHEADLGASHQLSRVIENRKNKLKKLLKEYKFKRKELNGKSKY